MKKKSENSPLSDFSLTNRSLAAAIFLLFFGAFFRVLRLWLGVDFLPNFAPMTAIALCGAAFLPRGVALVIPLAALFASDIFLNAYYHVSLFSSAALAIYACYGVTWLWGIRMGPQRLLPLLAACVGNALLFYFVTNTVAWFGNAAYAQTFAGWVQSLTVGVSGYAPTWMFFRNSLASDLLFTVLFYAVIKVMRPAPLRNAATVPAQ